MLLSRLLAPYISIPENQDREITSLCLSSYDVKPGALFFAYPGEKTDGRNYIEDAIEKGAVAIVAEENHWPLVGASGARPYKRPNPLQVSLKNLQHKIGPIAQLFYHYPSKDMQIIGVTGTNGKTSVAYILAQIFNLWGIHAVSMGTFGIGKPGGEFIETGINTPDPISLQRYFSELKQQGCKVVVMEVSSHALVQGRVEGISFDAAVFTNLTQDHLDYHHTMEEYAWAKKRLLKHHEVKNAIFNLDDPWCKNLYQRYKETNLPCFGYSHDHASKKLLETKTQLIGQFNEQNILAAVTCLLSLGFEEGKILAVLPEVKAVPGRLELVRAPGKPCCVIDYAHTPDALKKALIAVRALTSGKLYCVFGCGGNRDTSKRPLMAKIAEEYADEICVTDDNPRFEASGKILEDIMRGFSLDANVMVISNRATAIRATLSRAKEGDLVLIAGKGHEEYQIIKDEKIFFSDRLVTEKTLGL